MDAVAGVRWGTDSGGASAVVADDADGDGVGCVVENQLKNAEF